MLYQDEQNKTTNHKKTIFECNKRMSRDEVYGKICFGCGKIGHNTSMCNNSSADIIFNEWARDNKSICIIL
jgi:hypothetical protein